MNESFSEIINYDDYSLLERLVLLNNISVQKLPRLSIKRLSLYV